jgi:cytochrome c-type biogenesis protein CcmH
VAAGLLVGSIGWTAARAQQSPAGSPAATSAGQAPAPEAAAGSQPASTVEKGFVDFQTPGPEPLVQRSEEENSKLYLRLNAKFMSPYCPGLVLRDCTSAGGQNLREQIREWLHRGHTEVWITATMVATYGESVLAAPPFRGAAVVVWVAPFVALLIGTILLLRFLQAQKARHRVAATEEAAELPRTQPLDPDMDRRLEQEISARAR